MIPAAAGMIRKAASELPAPLTGALLKMSYFRWIDWHWPVLCTSVSILLVPLHSRLRVAHGLSRRVEAAGRSRRLAVVVGVEVWHIVLELRVIRGPLALVHQHFVGLRGFPEVLFGGRRRVHIGVVLQRHGPIRLLDVLRTGIVTQPQQCVVRIGRHGGARAQPDAPLPPRRVIMPLAAKF
eukprot:scaffold7375_cov268-Pinguiococcus_pyrenoidosus.AAC.24